MRNTVIAKGLRIFSRDIRGVSGIEFGILAPVLLLMLLGTIELGRAIDNNRHFVSTASTVGDLVAREASLGKTEATAKDNLDGMMKALTPLMAPYDSSELRLIVSSVRVSPTDDTKAKVDWSYSSTGDGALAECSDYTLPADIVPPGSSVIVVDATYTFKSLFGSFVPGMSSEMLWSDKSHHSPRNKCVDYVEGDNCTAAC